MKRYLPLNSETFACLDTIDQQQVEAMFQRANAELSECYDHGFIIWYPLHGAYEDGDPFRWGRIDFQSYESTEAQFSIIKTKYDDQSIQNLGVYYANN